jgi:hypothetical protein
MRELKYAGKKLVSTALSGLADGASLRGSAKT